MISFDKYLVPGARGHLIGVGGVSMSPLAEVLSGMAEETPLGRNGNPRDVAKAIAYLADADFVTGQVLGVNGGYVI